MIVNIANLNTIRTLLYNEFLKQQDPDLSIKLCVCMEKVDLLEPNDKGYQIKYSKELEIVKPSRKIKQNSIEY